MDDELQNPTLEEKNLTIEAVREGDDLQTRTYRKDIDGSIWWVPGDAISIFYGSGSNGGSKFTSVNTTDTTKVTNFTGAITAITGGGEITVDQTYFWGLYPYQEDASCDGVSVTMSLPKEQTAVPGTFATNLYPSLGKSQGLIMAFYNICSGMKFSVTKEGVKKVTLKSRGGEKITGKAKVNFKDGVPVSEIIDGSDEVILEAPSGEFFIPGKFYFLVMFPTTFSQGFTVKLETITEEAVVEKTGKLTANRSKFGKISNIDANATYSQKTGNIPVEDANFKAYLVDKFDNNSDGEISFEEAHNIYMISIDTDNIESVQGIEYMDKLISMQCTSISHGGLLRKIDVTNNKSLTRLVCSGNELANIDVSQNSALTYLDCGSNLISRLDVSENAALENLYCGGNWITSLDVSKNLDLRLLSCRSNALQSLDISNNTKIDDLDCSDNQLNNINISNNIALERLNCSQNLLTKLDLSKNSKLVSLRCDNNFLKELNVSRNTSLTTLDCSPMCYYSHSEELNILSNLYIANGQEIPNITINRNSNYVPDDTIINEYPENGEGEGTGEEDWEDDSTITMVVDYMPTTFQINVSGNVIPTENYDWIQWNGSSFTTQRNTSGYVRRAVFTSEEDTRSIIIYQQRHGIDARIIITVENIDGDSVRLLVRIATNYPSDYAEWGIQYGTENSSLNGTKVQQGNTPSFGEHHATVSGLAAGTLYYLRGYVKTTEGDTVYSSPITVVL